MGVLLHLGFMPTEGYFAPKGIQNFIPEKLRPYIPTYPKTVSPFLLSFYDLANHCFYPLGMKYMPATKFTSLERQMYKAIIDSDIEEIERLTEKENFNLESAIVLKDFNFTALGLACALNLMEPIHYLIKYKNVNANKEHGPYGKNALHIAVEHGNLMAAKLLLNNGADIFQKDMYGFDIYQKAEYRGYYEFSKSFDYFKNKNLNDDNNVKKEQIYNNYDNSLKETNIHNNLYFTKYVKPSSLLYLTVDNDILNFKYENEGLNKHSASKYNLEKFGINFYQNI